MGGLLTKGVVREGSRLAIGPLNDGTFKPVTVQSIHRNKVPCRVVRAGQSAALSLDCKVPELRRGMVLLQADAQASGCYYFQVTTYVITHGTATYTHASYDMFNQYTCVCVYRLGYSCCIMPQLYILASRQLCTSVASDRQQSS